MTREALRKDMARLIDDVLPVEVWATPRHARYNGCHNLADAILSIPIINASTDLLKALKELRAACNDDCGLPEEVHLQKCIGEACLKAAAAIAKAEGKP